ncbi:30S ribosomal protein S19e [Candidatus Micrarchaeota archaeon CG1_02_47_40]|nr:MAG: 30S ribosomal protein S19e [Candidatus Micrarchaeota archaeon CG1_02_47_40]
MVTVYDAEVNALIKEAARKLEEMGIKRPDYLEFVKSGAHAERRPTQQNFWHLRCASLLRKVYLSQGTAIGVNRLRRHYGGRKNRGVAPEKAKRASGSIIRRAFMALEKVGFVEKGKKGRRISPAGVKFLDSVARSVTKKES